MAEAVAGLLASPFVGIVKDKLRSAIAEQASLLWNFGDDLGELMDHLETISAVLVDAERQSVKGDAQRLWLKRLKYAAIDISDMLEDYQDTSEEANAMMPGVLSCLPMAYKKIGMANRMKSLREKLSKIRYGIDTFGFRKGSSTTNDQPNDERETTSYLPEQVVVMDGEKCEIINLLSANTNDYEQVIVPIFGLGGMGKSTLAQLVYNDAQFNNYDHRIWVYVSQDFNLNKIGSSIISQLPTQGAQQNMGTQQVIKQCLDNLIHGKKVLIVLDDLWEEKETELNKLKTMLHVKGSKVDVIVTTRKEEIAREICTCEPYKLKPLDDYKCWEIIKRYSKFDLKSNQEQMEKIGLDIAKKCGGVALAAQVVGSMLHKIDDLSGWIEINSSDIWNGSSENNDVLPSLKLSYERMPPLLRVCFSYCALFPKGHSIIGDDLVQQWISLDFIEQSKGNHYIKQLLGMSFLQVSELPSTSQENVVRYTMHDMVHDLARLTMDDELIDFNTHEGNTHGQKYCRYLLLNYDQTMKLTSILPSKIRALCFSDSGELDIQSGAFSFANCLHALGFCECAGIFFPASIDQLKQLRCLIAPRMQNKSLPECITELRKLQYLNINGSSRICALPESIGKLGFLKFLCLSGCSSISELPESLGDLKSMVHLDMSCCTGITDLPDSLGKLPNLQHLDLSWCTRMGHLERVRGLTTLQYLDMSYCHNILFQDLPDALAHLSDALANLTNLKHLRLINLIVSGANKASDSYVPDWIGCLTNLEHLDLSSNTGLACLPDSIGNLSRLHSLDLTNCRNLKSLPESIGTLGLKSLLLDECSVELMDHASSLVNYSKILPFFRVRADDVNGRSCSNLHLLKDVNVGELRIHFLENVRSLEEANKVKLCDKHILWDLTLVWSFEHAVRFLDDKDLLGQLVPPKGLKHMTLQGYSSSTFPDWLMGISHHLTNLVSISLGYLRTCSSLPPLGQLPHLRDLCLQGLHRVTKIDSTFCGGKEAFRRLSSFEVICMEGLEEWNTTYSVENDVDNKLMFPVLDRLSICWCPRLRLKPCPPTFRECYIECSDQVIASLEEVDNKTSHHCSSSSRAIKLDLDTSDSCQSIRIFHHFPQLQELTISVSYLTSLPESMRHLTSLESLRLESYQGIPELPEWLGDLSSLKSLVIERCRSKWLPSSIQRLTKLQKLEIRDNHELKEWCESEENKAKLAHIKDKVF